MNFGHLEVVGTSCVHSETSLIPLLLVNMALMIFDQGSHSQSTEKHEH